MGPLAGLRVIELVGLGPGPFAAMLLSDLGATVLRLDRAANARAAQRGPSLDLLARGRPSVGIDLKHARGADTALRLIAQADALIEGFRPGVMERLGLGPEVCLASNPRLVYGRMTGFGQEGPLRDRAGHDIDYIALTGALHAIGRSGEAPVPPLNLLGDFGGGALFLAFGVLCALFEAARSGRGQIVDAAMVDGSSTLMMMAHSMRAAGFQREARGVNLLDTGAHFYEVYETADAGHMAVGAIEPQFYAQLLAGLGLGAEALPAQMDRASWPAMKQRFAAVFKQKTRAQWTAIFEPTDACVAPVLSMSESMSHPHMKARGAFVDIAGVSQPAPAPRFSRTPPVTPSPPSQPGADTQRALADWGFTRHEIAALRADEVVA